MKIIELLSKLSGSEEVLSIGDKMRKDRNIDLYSTGLLIEGNEAKEYFDFVKTLSIRVFGKDNI